MLLRVMTYNIHRAIGVDRRFRLDRIIKILAHYDTDVVLLQEVDEGAPRSKELDLATELANALRYPYVVKGKNVVLRKGGYGNATLSRLPILQARNIDLTIGDRKRRGCLFTDIRMSGGSDGARSVKVFNLHLGLSLMERIQQMGVLARSREFGSVGDQQPCLMGGDFNDWRNLLSPILTDILGFSNSSAKTSGYRHVLRTYPSFSPQSSPDRIYYRGRMQLKAIHRCRMIISKVASDHLPVIADFELL